MKYAMMAAAAAFLIIRSASAQVSASNPDAQLKKALAQIEQLASLVAAQEARIEQLEAQSGQARSGPAQSGEVRSGEVRVIPVAFTPGAAPMAGVPMAGVPMAGMPMAAASAATTPEAAATVPADANPAVSATPSVEAADPHDHMINLPGGGPALKIRGFTDFNFGMGSVANPLQFPLNAPARNTFQAGEFDLFLSSKLSNHLSFVAEMVFGSDQTNLFSIDIERYQLTYKQNKHFEISAGRFHTSIGYYNTAYHHGTWFGTADGRPFMYYYEDSGGLLPVHNVGITATGLVPGADKFGLHWVAEVGNGRASNPNAAEPVQNFLSDRNHKAVNFALYIKPEWLEGLQMGGSFYDDKLYPDSATSVRQHIGSVYAVYFRNGWESLNEGVWLQNRSGLDGRTYNTPLMYTQISHQFGVWVPYFRFQYVNAPVGDPINVFAGRYEGPSEGVRYNFSDYAAFKLQYNRIYGLIGNTKPANGLDANVSFTF